jgi:sulfoxide reductase heme-binding subunit YedZ
MVLGKRASNVVRAQLRSARWLHILVHVGALVPLVVLVAQYALGRLSVNPIRDVTLRTGRTALNMLVLSLACTPLALVTGRAAIRALRRPLGLYAAFYAVLHFLVYAAWDYQLQFDLIWLELRSNRFLQVGLAALIILVALAVTSLRPLVRRMRRAWVWLHRLAYAAGLLAALHFFWAVKVDRRVPILYGAIVALLLVLRLPPVKEGVRKLRARVLA